MLLGSNMKNRAFYLLKKLMNLLFFMLFIPLCISYVNNENNNRAQIL